MRSSERLRHTRAFLCAGLLEESAKFLLFFLFIWKYREFDEPFDGILYMAYIGLGFSFVENITYLATYSASMLETAWARALFATPGHFLFGVVMGYFAGRARFARSVAARQIFLLSGWVAAVMLHGTYDFLLMQGDDSNDMALKSLLSFLFYVFDVVLWKIGLRRMKLLQ